MSRKQIIVKLDKNGRLNVEGDGFHGKECREATQAIRDALMSLDATEKEKSEMFSPPPPRMRHREFNG